MKKEKIKVYRTTEGTIFEIIFLVVLITVWTLLITYWHQAPDIIPTHFGIDGQPNDWGSKSGILIPCGITSLTGLVLMITAYFPHKVNIPVTVSSPRQWPLVVRMTRCMGLMMLVLTFTIGYTSLVSCANGEPSALPILSTVGALFAIIIVFCVLIHRAKLPDGIDGINGITL